MRRTLLLLALALSGCLEPTLVECANGTVCPSGTACDLVHATCTSPEQLAACNGIPDQMPCSAAPVTPSGACHGGVCMPYACGNGFTDPGEVCDDGNTAGGDGCSADCRSDETCGNGTIDLVTGEQCDDGNLRSHDGCDSRCRPETAVWHAWSQLGSASLASQASAYDLARERLVVFGGDILGGGISGATLEWDGTAWLDVSPPLSPPPRRLALMAYDAARHVVVLFGGIDDAQQYSDTWTWDGATWTEVTPASTPSPPARIDSQMAYDSTRARVVLFGGFGGGAGALADTWEWDGQVWTARTPAVSPPAATYGALGHDPIRGVTVLAAGSTWLWDGTTWAEGPDAPAGGFQTSLAWDPTRSCLVSSGGSSDTYCWTGAAWDRIGSGGPTQDGASVFFDETRGALVQAGGFVPNANQTAAMWQLSGSGAWAPIEPDPGPGGSTYAPMAYDTRRARSVLLAGTDSQGCTELWESVGHGWALHPVTGTCPAGDTAVAMTYDEGRARMVVYTFDLGIWEWDGARWTTSQPAVHPAATDSFGFAYDAALGKVLLFGGEDAQLHFLGETWTWDGTTWAQLATPTQPSARVSPTMAYDPRRGEMVLFGGGTNFRTAFDDTWVWTPADGWVQRVTDVAPAKRTAAAMAYDTVRDEMLLFGGTAGIDEFADLWHWDGAQWKRRALLPGPGASDGVQMVYDAANEQAMVFAQGTWVLQWTSDDRAELCEAAVDTDGDGLAGCADPDCAGLCAPTGSGGPTCGDGHADPTETCRLCPADLGACTAACGDGVCDPPETAASCPGDCAL